ncbi:MAG: serine/threonine-protein kinase, partial [Eubacteriales bacterium]|nr:serine/threonine-protein kinase [Eubacteriales bacterium]
MGNGTPAIGKVLDGRYLLKQILGKGGMGTVFLAENTRLGSNWAVKCIPPDYSGNVSMMPAEIEILRKLDHPALPKIYDIFEEEGMLFIISDYIEGTDLKKRLNAGGIPSEKEVVMWLLQLCDVLQYLHGLEPEPVIYRDMKPSNIILTNDGRIKLVDFGIARRYKEENLCDTVYIGTRGYAAPEQYGTGQTDARTDIYGLGMTLYHILTGISPDELFNRERPGKTGHRVWETAELPPITNYNREISTKFARIIARCTKQDREQRYASVSEMMGDIGSLESFKKVKEGAMPGVIIQNAANMRKSGNTAGADSDTPSAYGEDGNGLVTIRRLIITIIGEAVFASRLALVAAQMTKLKVLAIDFDLESCMMAKIFRINRNIEKTGDKEAKTCCERGIRVIAESASCCGGVKTITKSTICRSEFEKNCYRTTEGGRLWLLADPESIESSAASQSFNTDRAGEILEYAYKYFDLTIVHSGGCIYDPVAAEVLQRSDHVIFVSGDDEGSANTVRRRMEYFIYKNGLDTGKIFTAACSRKDGSGFSEAGLRKLFGKAGFLGKVRHDNELGRIFSERGFKGQTCSGIKREYDAILRRFGIYPKISPFQTALAAVGSFIKG